MPERKFYEVMVKAEGDSRILQPFSPEDEKRILGKVRKNLRGTVSMEVALPKFFIERGRSFLLTNPTDFGAFDTAIKEITGVLEVARGQWPCFIDDVVVIYWAAPCFSQADRKQNRLCAEYLRKKGYKVVLPQDEAAYFITEDKEDLLGLAWNCYYEALSSDIVIVILDGADPDSGASMEAGFKIRDGGLTLGVRTDIPGSEEKGLNAMFKLLTALIKFSSLNENHEELCEVIDRKLLEFFPERIKLKVS